MTKSDFFFFFLELRLRDSGTHDKVLCCVRIIWYLCSCIKKLFKFDPLSFHVEEYQIDVGGSM